MNNQHPGRAEDFTDVSMVMLLINLLWIFGVIWAAYGLAWVIVAGAVLNHLITRLALRKARRAYRDAPQGNTQM